MSTGTLTLDDFRKSVIDFGENVTAESDLMDKIQTVTSATDFAINLPGRIEFSMRVFQDGLTLPNAVTAALSFAPFGIGAMVRKTDKVADTVVDSLEPTRQMLENADKALKPLIEGFTPVSVTASGLKFSLDGVEGVAKDLLDTADYLIDALADEIPPEGSRLEERLEQAAEFLGDYNDLHNTVVTVAEALIDDMLESIDDVLGALPTDMIDDAAELIDTVFSPVTGALQKIEDLLCKTYTITPEIPAVYAPNPIAWIPGQPDKIQITPKIPALQVKPCDIIETLGNAIGIVQTFVENLVFDILDGLGLDLQGLIDSLQDKLLSPFDGLIDAVERLGDQLDAIADLIGDALDAVKDVFEELGAMLRDAFDNVVIFEAGQVGDEAPGTLDDVLTGTVTLEDGAVALATTAPGAVPGSVPTPTDDIEDGLFGRDGNDVLRGLGGDDFLFGGSGQDRHEGGTGNDENYGGEGDDTYVFTGAFGDDFVSDSEGASTFVFEDGVMPVYSRLPDDDLLIETPEGSVRVDGFFEGDQRATTTIMIGSEETKVNTPPTSPTLSASEIAENAAVGTVVGQFAATDPDGDPITYRLEDDAGGLFRIDGNTLVVAGEIDFETAPSLTVTVIADDGYSTSVASFTITVTDEVEILPVEPVLPVEPNLPPEDVELVGASVAEDAALGTLIGRVTADDPEGDFVSFRLLDDADGRVALDGERLITADSFDFETAESHEIMVEARDTLGNTTVETFTVAVQDVDESAPAPTPPPPSEGTPPSEGKPDADRFEFNSPDMRVVDAGEGLDTVSYAHTRDEVRDTKGDGWAQIALPGAAFDVLENVERVELEDGTYIFDMRPEADATYRLYTAALGRTADEAGLRFWDGQAEKGVPLKAIAQAFVDSDEFASLFGGENPSHADYVDELYDNVLGREGEAAGRDFWIRSLDQGMDDAELLMVFADSPENLAQTADDTDAGIWVL
ncbi:MAG: DUF4214 domain-containing protein [Pseudomonadota bacterium]